MSLSSSPKIGILGGGQLGRMLIQSGISLNIDFHALDPDAQAPCKSLVSRFVKGGLNDYEAVLAFGQGLDILTIEIEKVNTDAMEALERQGVKVYPQPAVVRLIQDKRAQKQFYQQNGIPTAAFELVENSKDVEARLSRFPLVQKTAKDGYDGKGVQVLRKPADLEKAFDVPGLLEELVDIEKELSVVVTRRPNGEMKCFPLVELVYHPEHNLVDYLYCPAEVPAHIAQQAQALAEKVAEKLNIVGLLAVEMFWTKSGEVLVNEIAPRPHNSGHHTIEATYTSQYAQHLRAILDLPLGNTDLREPGAMINLLGEDGFEGPAYYQGLDETLQIPGVYVHLYGKTHTKPFRKMGHVTILGKNRAQVIERMEQVRKLLRVVSI
jgi:5-(carboxyamino)imidazole ribonucleotide synthase